MLLASTLIVLQGASLPATGSSASPVGQVVVADGGASATQPAGAQAAAQSAGGATSALPVVDLTAFGGEEPDIVHPSPRGCQPPPSIKAAPVVRHGSRDAKVVALTFDDGYNPENTAKILSILQHAKVNATFLPVGRAVAREPDTWKAIAAAGYPIADHTWDHPHLNGRCYADQVTELLRQQSIVRRITGIDPIAIMRPPYGAYDRVTRLAAADAGDVDVVLWDIDTRDWSGISARMITRRALAGTNGSIILMHTMPENTARALPRIIAGYRARGYTFVTLGQLLGIPGPIPYT